MARALAVIKAAHRLLYWFQFPLMSPLIARAPAKQTHVLIPVCHFRGGILEEHDTLAHFYWQIIFSGLVHRMKSHIIHIIYLALTATANN